jgi:predicted nucleic acid-binding protein
VCATVLSTKNRTRLTGSNALGSTADSMLLLDNSAWARLPLPALPDRRREEIAGMIEAGEIAVCIPFLLEAGWSARTASHHDELLADLLLLPRLTIDADVEEAALAAQTELAHRGHHRSASPSDILIASCAHINSAGVLHYDRDYDLLVELTGFSFESQWLAPAGSL